LCGNCHRARLKRSTATFSLRWRREDEAFSLPGEVRIIPLVYRDAVGPWVVG
jgi:hypothetical protein